MVDANQTRNEDEVILIRTAESLSKAHMDSYEDPSHDWYGEISLESEAVLALMTALVCVQAARATSTFDGKKISCQ